MVIDLGTTSLPIWNVEQVHCPAWEMGAGSIRSVLKRLQCWHLKFLWKAFIQQTIDNFTGILSSHIHMRCWVKFTGPPQLWQIGTHGVAGMPSLSQGYSPAGVIRVHSLPKAWPARQVLPCDNPTLLSCLLEVPKSTRIFFLPQMREVWRGIRISNEAGLCQNY